VGIAISSIATLSIREPAPEEPCASSRRRQGDWLHPLARDRDYRRLIAARLLVGTAALATPFYVVHAADVLNLPERTIGTFVVANTLGSLASSAILGFVGERRGPRFIIRASTAVAASGPVFVLLVHLIDSPWLAAAYPYAFVALGISRSAWMLGFTNYTLEIAPDGRRPAYVGLSNTLMGALAFAPAVGGWLLEVSSYTVLFAAASVLALSGAALTLTLRPSQEIALEHAASGA
jgi:predicted MFS family arabinose efflux permease